MPGLSAYSAEFSLFRSELLDRYFSPEWKAACRALDTQFHERVFKETPELVQAEQRAEQRAPYLANLRNQFAKKYGVQVFPNQDDLTTNPFNFEGKTVGIVVVPQ